ncbi:hypothetical protein INT44_000661 [Umbelopsis vinacea]|uniref:Uncharacterized protein n=1 Tax=Umbelopsis vinacea TaxID=44442 RepID=A0A8H7UJ70_9FUNG|nr:hypothetical protein INT44_000661 [Umbelopsis vinacea]
MFIATLSSAAPIYRMELHYQQMKQGQGLQSNSVRQSMNQANTAIANYLDPEIWPESASESRLNVFADVLKQIRQLPHQLLTPPADVKERFSRNTRDELGYAEWLVEITL